MYNIRLHRLISDLCLNSKLDIAGQHHFFYTRLVANATAIHALYLEIYGSHPAKDDLFVKLLQTLVDARLNRSSFLVKKDDEKEEKDHWFLSNEITGMSLYVDRCCGNLTGVADKLGYFSKLGVNLLHLMPIFQSPEGESDGGYAVSDFRSVDAKFGTEKDLHQLVNQMQDASMYLMLDIVLNHTSHQHNWALLARQGDPVYQAYFYMYDDRTIPDQFDHTMPEIFPESAPGNFTYIKECNKWVMTVFHHYQWDLNYTNPAVFVSMLDNILYYANLGIDILRIDAPAFIWKQLGTTCQNLPQAHSLLRLIRQCVQVVAPGMALLGEAIVAPKEIMKYFGDGLYTARECDFAYNATQMALQWDALATGDTRVMLAAQHELLRKPFGTSWISYTRCHDDIGLGYDDSMINAAGFNPYEHRKFLKDYYSGEYQLSPASGALFSVNPKTQDARISGSLASLCGLEKAIIAGDNKDIELSIRKIVLMQAQSFFMGGIPMLFYGDEVGYTNDYSYQHDPVKSYDNRWMHRPVIDWKKNKKAEIAGTIEEQIFSATQKLIQLRKQLPMVADYKNTTWLTPYNIHVAGFIRQLDERQLYCLFNFSSKTSYLTWHIFKENRRKPHQLFDHWQAKKHTIGADYEYFIMEPYTFCLLEVVE